MKENQQNSEPLWADDGKKKGKSKKHAGIFLHSFLFASNFSLKKTQTRRENEKQTRGTERGGGELLWDQMSGCRRRSCGVGLQLRSDFHTKGWSYQERDDQLTVCLSLCLPVSLFGQTDAGMKEVNLLRKFQWGGCRRRNEEKCRVEGKVKAVLNLSWVCTLWMEA